jgi:5'-nucleotidase
MQNQMVPRTTWHWQRKLSTRIDKIWKLNPSGNFNVQNSKFKVKMAVHKKFNNGIRNNALGRGLDALISTEGVRTQGSSTINEIPLDQIEANPNQPRREFDEEALRELADSISAIGIIQPITLRQISENRFQIIAGERRWRASQLAGLMTIPAYIRTISDENVMEMALVENIQRQDLNAIEIALAYEHLLENEGMTQEKISERVGKSRAAIANYLRLLKLPAQVQMALQKKEIDMGHCRALLALDSPSLQIKLFKEIQKNGYSVRKVEEMVQRLKSGEDVLVVAPESARSGFACAFSATTPLRLKRRHNMGEDVEVWSCSGTPVDCVKLALDQFYKDRRPDLVIGGINHGDNSSVNNHYSGTMGVAKEGCMQHIPSIAFSSCNYDENADLSPLRDGVTQVVKMVLEKGLPKYTCLNVNFPAQPPFKGFKACRMAHGSWINEVEHRTHPHGYEYYWMVGDYRNDEPDAADTDQWAVNHGYIAITPTKIDITDYDWIKNFEL